MIPLVNAHKRAPPIFQFETVQKNQVQQYAIDHDRPPANVRMEAVEQV